MAQTVHKIAIPADCQSMSVLAISQLVAAALGFKTENVSQVNNRMCYLDRSGIVRTSLLLNDDDTVGIPVEVWLFEWAGNTPEINWHASVPN